MSNPLFTVVICTYNRADVLPRSIEAARAQTLSSDRYEILVVDNNSTDATREIVGRYAAQIQSLRCVGETRQGLSHARNRAMEEARGDYLVYVDDDAEMTPGYLDALDRLIREEGEIGAAGGPIEVGWLERVPEWYEPNMDIMFNHLYIASYRMRLQYPKILYGTNMAFPTGLLRELGGFNTKLGRIGTNLLACEDGEIMLRIEKKTGRPIFWDPALRVKHLIHPGRLSIEYLCRKAEWGGRSQCLLERLYPGSGGLAGPVFGLFENVVRMAVNRRRGRHAERIGMLYNWGYIKQRFSRMPKDFV